MSNKIIDLVREFKDLRLSELSLSDNKFEVIDSDLDQINKFESDLYKATRNIDTLISQKTLTRIEELKETITLELDDLLTNKLIVNQIDFLKFLEFFLQELRYVESYDIRFQIDKFTYKIQEEIEELESDLNKSRLTYNIEEQVLIKY